jgi:predicted small lipoprotein YifL
VMNGRLMRLGAGLMLVLALAACGKKGPPAAPKDEPSTYPRAYPRDTTDEPAKPTDPSGFPTLRPNDTNTDPSQSMDHP